MPSYKIDYETWNHYENHVGESFFSLLILPCEDNLQQTSKYHLENSIGESTFIVKNHFGFNQVMLHSLKSFDELHIKMSCNVRVLKNNPFGIKTLDIKNERTILGSDDFKVENFVFLQNSHYTEIPKDIPDTDWHIKDGEPVMEFLKRVNDKIYSELTFDPDDTHINQKAISTLEKKTGVCQDFAHLFLGIARANHIPCRYVSGYLNQGEKFVGAAMMHAWVEALIPGAGWVGFDPTNNLLRDEHYVKVSHGSDYDDCSPIKGVLKTSGDNKTNYSVKVVQQQ